MAGGLLGDLLPSAPDRTIVPQDQQSNELINAGIARAKRSPQEFGNDINQNVSEFAGNLGSQNTAQEAAQTGQDPATLAAMSGVYRGQAQGDIDKLMKTTNQNAQFQKAESLRKMAMAAMGRQQAQTNIYQQLTEAYNQQETARAGLVSSIFQAGRAGMMMQPKPKGAPNFETQMENLGPGQTGGYAPDSGSSFDAGNMA